MISLLNKLMDALSEVPYLQFSQKITFAKWEMTLLNFFNLYSRNVTHIIRKCHETDTLFDALNSYHPN